MKRIVWLTLSGLMALSMILASCAPAEPTTPPITPPPTTEVTPPPTTPSTTTPEKPKYGGTLVIGFEMAIQGWDHEESQVYSYGAGLINEVPQVGSWARGPAGTGERDWLMYTFVLPDVRGCLAESWSIPDPNTITYKVRKGVHWALDPTNEASRLVAGREFTAEDLAYNISRTISNPQSYQGKATLGYLQSVEVNGDTVTVHGKDTSAATVTSVFELISGLRMYPREVIEKYGNMRNWKNIVGTGAFMLEDYVSGSSLSLKRNPNYWGTDQTGPGKGNQLPYLNGVKILVIPDMSTRLAAVRTGKTDYEEYLSIDDLKIMQQSAPHLQNIGYLRGGPTAGYIGGRVDKNLPFNDLRVRRAMMMAINQQEIARDLYGGRAEILWYPTVSSFSSLYTPIEKLPASTQELYQYNPEKAKQLLAEAGYPNGFKTEVVVPATPADVVDKVSVYKAYLAKVGIDLDIKVHEETVWQSMRVGKTFNAMIFAKPTIFNPYTLSHAQAGAAVNSCGINDPIVNDAFSKIWLYDVYVGDPAERARLVKERDAYVISQAWFMTFPMPYGYQVWWPWVKNFHGELFIHHATRFGWTYYIWYDQALKKSMGY